jgi:hypothetical protein
LIEIVMPRTPPTEPNQNDPVALNDFIATTDLTNDERSFLQCFRNMDDHDRKYIVGLAEDVIKAHQRNSNADDLPLASSTKRVATFVYDHESAYAPGVTLRQIIDADFYVGTADALVAAGVMDAHMFPGQPGMRKTVVTIFADGSLPTGAPTANNSRSSEPGAKRIQRDSKTKFNVRVNVTESISKQRLAARAIHAKPQQLIHAMPRQARPSPGQLYRENRAGSNVVHLQRTRPAGRVTSTEKEGEWFLYDVTQAESVFLSHFYQHGIEKAALRLLRIADSGPDWDPKQS